MQITENNNPLPDFFVLGAPKCGTTSMDEWLKSHPAIWMAEKEPHYFNTDHQNRKITQLSDYQALFAGATEKHSIIGETSVRYLYSKDAVANILKFNANAKFIVMLRNPINMVYSWHNQVYFSGMEDVKDFETAWQLQTQRKQGKHIPKRCSEVKMLFYGELCCLGQQLQTLYQQVSKERVHIVLLDDLAKNPQQSYQSILKFLGLADDGKQQFDIYNKAKTYRFIGLDSSLFWLGQLKIKLGFPFSLGILEWLRKHNKKIKQRPTLSANTRAILVRYFSNDIALLAKLIHQDLSHWTK